MLLQKVTLLSWQIKPWILHKKNNPFMFKSFSLTLQGESGRMWECSTTVRWGDAAWPRAVWHQPHPDVSLHILYSHEQQRMVASKSAHSHPFLPRNETAVSWRAHVWFLRLCRFSPSPIPGRRKLRSFDLNIFPFSKTAPSPHTFSLKMYWFIYGCNESSLLHTGLLQLQRAGATLVVVQERLIVVAFLAEDGL